MLRLEDRLDSELRELLVILMLRLSELTDSLEIEDWLDSEDLVMLSLLIL